MSCHQSKYSYRISFLKFCEEKSHRWSQILNSYILIILYGVDHHQKTTNRSKATTMSSMSQHHNVTLSRILDKMECCRLPDTEETGWSGCCSPSPVKPQSNGNILNILRALLIPHTLISLIK